MKRKQKGENDHNHMMNQKKSNDHTNYGQIRSYGYYPFREFSPQRNLSNKQQGNLMSNTEQLEAQIDTTAKCFLIEKNGLKPYEPGSDEIMFKFTLDLMTDVLPNEISWALLSSNDRSKIIIDSTEKNSTTSNSLSSHTFHTFEYECYIKAFESSKEIWFEFDIYDSNSDTPGFCCRYGLGYFIVSINEEKAISDRLYGRALTTLFCVDNNGELIDKEKEKEKTQSSIYPSRECISGRCICDSNPSLMRFEEEDSDEMYEIKMNAMVKMMALSGSEKLMDILTPQFKAACWTLNDDLFSIQQLESTSMSPRKIEQHMVQRYILALFYFATSGQIWKESYNFLSSRSECEWNSADTFHNKSENVTFIGGSICDEDERVISIIFVLDNLNGTIVDELFGLKNLEQLMLWDCKDLHGTIPSSFGRLSELRELVIADTSVEGSIPPQLFGATKIQELSLVANNLSGTIPESIGNLQDLSHLYLAVNNLSRSVPENIYHLKNLVFLNIGSNKLTGTISSLIHNLDKLEHLGIGMNKFSGTIPSSMKHLRQLKEIYFIDNELSGTFPNFLSFSPDLDVLLSQNNSFTGSVSDAFCGLNMETGVSADCRNDIFKPKVDCSCCKYCVDKTPAWDGECADTEVTIQIDHEIISIFAESNSDDLIWSLVDHSSEKNILHKGPFHVKLDYESSYEACIAYSQCFSLVMLAPPVQDTNYTIFWNEGSIYNDTFTGRTSSEPTQTMVNFWYDIEREQIKFDKSTTCNNLQLVCGKKSIDLEFRSIQRIMYDEAVKISGRENLQDPSSHQSKALCWILSNGIQNVTVQPSIQELIQRYVLTLLHLTSKTGLFGTDEYPPLNHECEWQSIECSTDDTSKMVTSISLSSSNGQIMNGALINEIGSLAYLEKLELKHTELSGTIPRSFCNLWSLTKLDLSQNRISGVIPETLFRRLNKLEHIDLSDNLLGGNIPRDMGSYSPLQTVLLNNNKLQGSLSFENFSYNDLENFDVHENLLDGKEFFLLSKHTKLKKLDLSSNFFVATLHEEILETLTELEIFNISQNEFSGVLPSKFPLNSKITHFDVHANRIKGTIHDSISKLSKLEYLNLQGNQFTGSIPDEMNQLEQLNTLVLSHNQLKGPILLDSNKLPNMKTLFLHANELSGEAPEFMKMDLYISDCGVPSEAIEPVQCNTCNVCCNSENLCHTQIISSMMKPMIFALGFLLSLIGSMLILYLIKDRLTQNKYFVNFFEKQVALWKAPQLLGEKTVYHFFLIPNKKGWLIAFSCSIVQIATLALFDLHADTTNEHTDMEYTMSCSENSLECEDTESRSIFGYSILGLLLSAWLLKNIVGGFKLFLLSLWHKNIDFFFTSSVVIVVTLFSALTSIYYNLAIATKDTGIITNAVVLLFVNEIDERLYQLAEACDINWVREVDESLRRDSYFNRRDLFIQKSLHKLRKSTRNAFSMKKEKGRTIDDVEDVLKVCEDERDISMDMIKEVEEN